MTEMERRAWKALLEQLDAAMVRGDLDSLLPVVLVCAPVARRHDDVVTSDLRGQLTLVTADKMTREQLVTVLGTAADAARRGPLTGIPPKEPPGMTMDIRAIGEERLARWLERLVTAGATPIVLVGVALGEQLGDIIICTPESDEMTPEAIAGFLLAALMELDEDEGPLLARDAAVAAEPVPGTEDPLLGDFQREFAALAKASGPIQFSLRPLDVWVLLSQVQLALRHPANTGPMATIARRLARALERLVATSPALAEIARRGWRPEHDL